jgi:hypothetical protein
MSAKKKPRTRRKPAGPKRLQNGHHKKESDSLALEVSDAVMATALAKFRESGIVSEACATAQISRQTWYNWIERDAVFARAVMAANEDVIDELEKEAVERAKDGSDTLLIFLLKAKRPEQYRETHKIEVVSPAVRENLRQTIAIINEELDSKDAERVLERLDKVWSAAA